MKKAEEEQRKEAFREMRQFYLYLREAGFTMEEAFAFMVAAGRNPPKEDDD